MIKAVFFDLDGTLLPMNEELFVKKYFGLLAEKLEPFGYDKEKLIGVVWEGVKLMYKNDGTKTNEQLFWDYFVSVMGEKSLKDKPIFDEFYANEFKGVKSVTEENPYAKQIIDFLKGKVKVILSTNPFFPRVGVNTRLEFIGLNVEDFDYVTTYENSRYSKPNPKYFEELLNKFNLKPDEVLFFGNNEKDDAECACLLGIKTYLVGDYIVKYDKFNRNVEHISLKDVISTIKKEFNI